MPITITYQNIRVTHIEPVWDANRENVVDILVHYAYDICNENNVRIMQHGAAVKAFPYMTDSVKDVLRRVFKFLEDNHLGLENA